MFLREHLVSEVSEGVWMPTRLLFDIETDGLLESATKVHCAAVINVDTGEHCDYQRLGIPQFLHELEMADTLIGHNIQRFDLPVLAKLYGFSPRAKILDTFIIAKLIHPDVAETDRELIIRGKMPAGNEYAGKHSLAAWGYRLGEHKGDYAKIKEAEAISKGITDPDAITRYVWGEWNYEMHQYMLQDAQTTYALWQHLDVSGYSELAIQLEHRIAAVCDDMESTGVPFDSDGAARLHSELVTRRGNIERELTERFGSWYQPVSPDPKRATFTPKRDNARLGYVAGAACTKLKLVEFNPSSRDHIARVLRLRGWQPTEFTPGGKPKINEETVESIVARYPEFAGLGEYLMLDKRISQLANGDSALLQHVRSNGRIHGIVNPMGTVTGRASHFRPNLGQVPNLANPYGKEFRSLFSAPAGWTVVGADMQGLELRGLAHYLAPLDGGSYARTVLEGDPHWQHALAMGLAETSERDPDSKLDRIIREDGSKRFIYAFLYGCGNRKAGEIIYTTVLKAARQCGEPGLRLYKRFFSSSDFPSQQKLARVGGSVRSQFLTKIPALAKLKGHIKREVESTGTLPGLDRRRIKVRSEHSALNALIQCAGAVLCKEWVVDTVQQLEQSGLVWGKDYFVGLWVHDEMQIWCHDEHADLVKGVIVEQAEKAGEPFGFRVRLDSEAKIGPNWAATH